MALDKQELERTLRSSEQVCRLLCRLVWASVSVGVVEKVLKMENEHPRCRR